MVDSANLTQFFFFGRVTDFSIYFRTQRKCSRSILSAVLQSMVCCPLRSMEFCWWGREVVYGLCKKVKNRLKRRMENTATSTRDLQPCDHWSGTSNIVHGLLAPSQPGVGVSIWGFLFSENLALPWEALICPKLGQVCPKEVVLYTEFCNFHPIHHCIFPQTASIDCVCPFLWHGVQSHSVRAANHDFSLLWC